MTTVKVGQRWQFTYSKYEIFIVEITNAQDYFGPVIQLVKGNMYGIGTKNRWSIADNSGWQYLEGQDKE